jgi:hypothetical protein
MYGSMGMDNPFMLGKVEIHPGSDSTSTKLAHPSFKIKSERVAVTP